MQREAAESISMFEAIFSFFVIIFKAFFNVTFAILDKILDGPTENRYGKYIYHVCLLLLQVLIALHMWKWMNKIAKNRQAAKSSEKKKKIA
jgi:ABC-type Fe3+-siderophore transport system permease subunit